MKIPTLREEQITTVCMYCKIVIKQGDGSSPLVSHGLCPKCAAKLEEEEEERDE